MWTELAKLYFGFFEGYQLVIFICAVIFLIVVLIIRKRQQQA